MKNVKGKALKVAFAAAATGAVSVIGVAVGLTAAPAVLPAAAAVAAGSLVVGGGAAVVIAVQNIRF